MPGKKQGSHFLRSYSLHQQRFRDVTYDQFCILVHYTVKKAEIVHITTYQPWSKQWLIRYGRKNNLSAMAEVKSTCGPPE